MTDTRLPEHWLNSLRFDPLSDGAWRVFTSAMMWSNSKGTDGAIPTRYLRLLHPNGTASAYVDELTALGLWNATQDGYQFIGWVEVLGQSTAEMVETYKERNRTKQAKARARIAGAVAPKSRTSFDEGEHWAATASVTGDVTGYVTGDVTEHVTEDVGHDRAGIKGVPEEQETQAVVNESTGEVTAAKASQAKASHDSIPTPTHRWVEEDGVTQRVKVAS